MSYIHSNILLLFIILNGHSEFFQANKNVCTQKQCVFHFYSADKVT